MIPNWTFAELLKKNIEIEIEKSSFRMEVWKDSFQKGLLATNDGLTTWDPEDLRLIL